jgi:hypothetical protein
VSRGRVYGTWWQRSRTPSSVVQGRRNLVDRENHSEPRTQVPSKREGNKLLPSPVYAGPTRTHSLVKGTSWMLKVVIGNSNNNSPQDRREVYNSKPINGQ